MTVRSTILIPPAVIPNVTTTAYTCPAGYTALVKWASVVNVNAAAQAFSLYINDGSGDRRLILRTIPAASDVQIPLWWVLEPGDILRWAFTAATQGTGAVFGTELLGVAP